MRLIVSLLVLGLWSALSNAQEANTGFSNTQTRSLTVDASNGLETHSNDYRETLAEQFGLTLAEWERYETLMRGPRGYQSPGLDPVTTLGVEARTDAEREKYARLLVRMEFERTEKEFALERAVGAAWMAEFPNVQRIASIPRPQSIDLSAEPKRFSLVLKRRDCEACNSVLERYLSGLSETSYQLDLYVQDTEQDDAALIQWVTDAGIDKKHVASGKLTVSHGDEYGHLPAPAVFMEDETGSWSREL